jgi:hypothetical protein
MKHLVDKATPVFAIHALNAALLVILMIGVPAVTGFTLGSLRISSYPWLQRLLLAGLGVGVAGNLLMGWWCRPRRQRKAYRGWALLHAAILAMAILTYSGWMDFDWLRELLQGARRVRAMAIENGPAQAVVAGALLGADYDQPARALDRARCAAPAGLALIPEVLSLASALRNGN